MTQTAGFPLLRPQQKVGLGISEESTRPAWVVIVDLPLTAT